MALSPEDAVKQARRLRSRLDAERQKLDVVRRYWTGRMGLPLVVPNNVPREVREMARIASGINISGIVVESLAQSLFVDGFRGQPDSGRAPSDENLAVWNVWQANKFDAHQAAIHRPALAYGVAYAVVWPNALLPEALRLKSGQPVIHGTSPRKLTAEYDDRAPTWPTMALESVGKGEHWLYDAQAVYTLKRDDTDNWTHVDTMEHGLGVTPVIRYLEVEDPDRDDEPAPEGLSARSRSSDRLVSGQVAPLMSLQDQVSLITFNLLIAQHFGAFRQRWVIGWTNATEDKAAKMSASRLMAFKDSKEDIQVGEFGQTDLSGYIQSREATLKYAATLSQTPVHELIGELVNLSAEALAAAEAGKDRKVDERKTMFGEAHEQTLGLVAELIRTEVPDGAQVVWRDTSARSFAATVDALGKLVTMLGIPAEELWERVPGATQQDVERWKRQAAQGDSIRNLTELLNRQAGPLGQLPAERRTETGIILPVGAAA